MSVADPALARFREAFAGDVVLPTDPTYDETRRVWSALYDRRPGIVVRPVSATDVASALRFARERDLLISVRAGGHSVSGHSTCDGGMVIDLSAMRGVAVDAERGVARASGGALLSELDGAAQAHGLVCPIGTVGHTGLGGLVLGGGVGRLQRRFGLTLDNLAAVEVVTADGRSVRASEDENADLFWGIRGAGPNFGVVTAFELRLHPFGPDLSRGLRIFRGTDAGAVWQAYRERLRSAPPELGLSFVLGRALPEGDFPTDVAGGPIVVVAANHAGGREDLERLLAPVDAAAAAIMASTTTSPYLQIQAMYDSSNGPGQRYYCHGGFADDLRPVTIDALVGHVADAAGDWSFSVTGQGGAIRELSDDATAFAGRSAWLRVTAEAEWKDPAAGEEAFDWARRAMVVAQPDLTTGRYVNEVFEDGTDPATIYGDDKLRRLVAIKREWDPDNVFRMNHNIAP
jgi:FAD/FMN-containing dehydrogenase